MNRYTFTYTLICTSLYSYLCSHICKLQLLWREYQTHRFWCATYTRRYAHVCVFLPFSLARCDSGWSGSTCDSRTGYMSPQLRDTFTGQPNNDNWLHMNGGQLTHDCGVMASGKALHFNGVSEVRLNLQSSTKINGIYSTLSGLNRMTDILQAILSKIILLIKMIMFWCKYSLPI